MKPSDPSRRTAILEKLALLQPVTLKELTAAMGEDYTFVIRTMRKYRKAGAAHRSGWEIHYSRRTALWSAGAGEETKPPKAKPRTKAVRRTYHREYYHRCRKQRLNAANSPTYNSTLSALMGLGGKAA